MLLQITKNTSKQHLLSYNRDNGTQTWMHASDFFVRHDLSHFALEKTLRYSAAFMGMLNNGMDIHDFEKREKRLQMNISKEAWYAENMANLFLIEISQGRFDDFNEVSKQAFETMKRDIPAPALTEEELYSTRNYLEELLTAWNELPEGEQ
jgi:hypothetical protein